MSDDEPPAREGSADAIERLRKQVERLTWAVAVVAVCQLVLVAEAVLAWLSGWGFLIFSSLLLIAGVYAATSDSAVGRAVRAVSSRAADAVRLLFRTKTRDV